MRRGWNTQHYPINCSLITFPLLCRYPPFYAETEKELFRLTRMGDYEFHEESWDHISIGAKDLISILLQTNPKVRATAADVLEHKWMKAEKKSLKMMNLSKSQVALKSTLAKQKLKKAMLTVCFLYIACTVFRISLYLSSNLCLSFTAGASYQQNCWRRWYFLGKEKDCTECRIRVNCVLDLMCHFRM